VKVGTGVACAPVGGAEPEPEPEAEAEAEGEGEGEAEPETTEGPLAGWFGPPGLAATVPHPAASAPTTSTGAASRAIELRVIGVVI
jgi:hypothetical protein